VLMTEKPEVMKAALDATKFKAAHAVRARRAICGDGALAKESGCRCVRRLGCDLIPLTQKLTEMGLKDLVLDPGCREIKQAHQDMIAIRARRSRRKPRPGLPDHRLPL